MSWVTMATEAALVGWGANLIGRTVNCEEPQKRA